MIVNWTEPFCNCHMQAERPLVSIIIPAYNVEPYINCALDSVVGQTYNEWEIIAVDDGSTDGTLRLLKEYLKKDPRIHIYELGINSGPAVARNFGIREAKGKYIAFMDADDWWYPTKLEEQISFMLSKGYEFTFTAFEYTDNDLNVTGISHKPSRISYFGILRGNNIGTPGVVFDVEALGKMYMPQMRMSEDWALWISIIKKTGAAYSLNKPLWKYRDHLHSPLNRKFSFLKSNYHVYTDVVGMPCFLAFFMLIVVFLPCQIIKRIFNKLDSWWYMRMRH